MAKERLSLSDIPNDLQEIKRILLEGIKRINQIQLDYPKLIRTPPEKLDRTTTKVSEKPSDVTSKRSAKFHSKLPTQRRDDILALMRKAGSRGMTAEEVSAALNIIYGTAGNNLSILKQEGDLFHRKPFYILWALAKKSSHAKSKVAKSSNRNNGSNGERVKYKVASSNNGKRIIAHLQKPINRDGLKPSQIASDLNMPSGTVSNLLYNLGQENITDHSNPPLHKLKLETNPLLRGYEHGKS